MMRKVAALSILSVAAGIMVEAQSPFPQWHRVPLDGLIVIGVASAVAWALAEVEEGK